MPNEEISGDKIKNKLENVILKMKDRIEKITEKTKELSEKINEYKNVNIQGTTDAQRNLIEKKLYNEREKLNNLKEEFKKSISEFESMTDVEKSNPTILRKYKFILLKSSKLIEFLRKIPYIGDIFAEIIIMCIRLYRLSIPILKIIYILMKNLIIAIIYLLKGFMNLVSRI